MEHAQFSDTEIEIRHLRDHYEILKEKVGDTDKTGLAIEFEVLFKKIKQLSFYFKQSYIFLIN